MASGKARRASRGKGPGQSAPLVDALFARVGLTVEARRFRALYAWHLMAGPRLRKHTRAERVLHRTLVVRVATAPWANELSFMRAGLLEKLKQTPGAESIDELRFTIGPIDELPDFSVEDTERPPAPPPAARPPVDAGPVAAALLQVADPELRGALAELFARASATR